MESSQQKPCLRAEGASRLINQEGLTVLLTSTVACKQDERPGRVAPHDLVQLMWLDEGSKAGILGKGNGVL